MTVKTVPVLLYHVAKLGGGVTVTLIMRKKILSDF